MTGEGAFLTAQQFQAAWRPLTAEQLTYAADLLGSAGDWIREKYRTAKGVEIADDNPAARTVSIDVVKTAISTGAYQGHISYSRVEGARQKSGTLLNAGGALSFTDWHKQQLGLPINALAQAVWDDCDRAGY